MTTAAPVTVYRIPDGTFEPRAEGYSYGVERHNGMERTYRATRIPRRTPHRRHWAVAPLRAAPRIERVPSLGPTPERMPDALFLEPRPGWGIVPKSPTRDAKYLDHEHPLPERIAELDALDARMRRGLEPRQPCLPYRVVAEPHEVSGARGAFRPP